MMDVGGLDHRRSVVVEPADFVADVPFDDRTEPTGRVRQAVVQRICTMMDTALFGQPWRRFFLIWRDIATPPCPVSPWQAAQVSHGLQREFNLRERSTDATRRKRLAEKS
jgi:hypothetical protein